MVQIKNNPGIASNVASTQSSASSGASSGGAQSTSPASSPKVASGGESTFVRSAAPSAPFAPPVPLERRVDLASLYTALMNTPSGLEGVQVPASVTPSHVLGEPASVQGYVTGHGGDAAINFHVGPFDAEDVVTVKLPSNETQAFGRAKLAAPAGEGTPPSIFTPQQVKGTFSAAQDAAGNWQLTLNDARAV